MIVLLNDLGHFAMAGFSSKYIYFIAKLKAIAFSSGHFHGCDGFPLF